MGTYNYLTNTGVVVADTADTRSEVESEYRAIFGSDFVVDPETPEGALITAEVTSRQSVARNNANLANQINPNIAGGTFLDAIWSLTAGGRRLATRSTVQCVITGVSGTVVPAGSMASDGTNNWLLASETVIPASGSISASFNAENTGPISASVNTITTIVDNSVLGWETVNNDVAAVPGQSTQSDVSARRDRRNQLGLQGRSTAVAITSNLSDTTGVRSFAFRENPEDSEQDIDGITLAPHSIWAAVDGGADQDIGNALLEAKSAGANWNGSQTVNVVEQASGQTFIVRFDRPTQRAVLVRITARATTGVDPTNQIVDAVIAYANGESDVGSGFVTGNDVSPFEISAAINTSLPGAFVSNCEVAFVPQSGDPSYGNTTLDIALNEIATIDRAAITVNLL